MTTIRVATEADAEEILAIYAKYIEQTAITFEYVVPSIEEFRGRIRHTLERFPYLAAEKDGKIAGYAYVSPFKERAAYDWSVETSIYVDMEQKRSGIGRRLYEELENILKQQGILNVNACIAYPNPQSIAFHEKMGYAIVGTFHRCAFKFNKCYHMVWLEKILTQTDTTPLPVIPFSQLDKALINKIVLE